MELGKRLFNIMVQEGVKIPSEEREKVITDLQKAVDSKRVEIIERDGQPIGFFTYIEKSDRVLINYAFIYKQFRNRFNFMSLRKKFRDKFNMHFVWRSRKRNRLCYVK